jgi:CO dehydrogenase/acetyl-CoA synthase beta subunit
MDNVQKINNCINIPSSQTFRSCYYHSYYYYCCFSCSCALIITFMIIRCNLMIILPYYGTDPLPCSDSELILEQ